jgi:hypothetical protein
MTDPTVFVAELERFAEETSAAESAYRREAADRIGLLARERVFAFRRLHLLRSVTQAIAGAESGEAAVSGVNALLCARLGWSGDNEGHAAILSAFAPVTLALFAGDRSNGGSTAGDVSAALAAFESWYAGKYAAPFWSLFDEYVVETPVVDF